MKRYEGPWEGYTLIPTPPRLEAGPRLRSVLLVLAALAMAVGALVAVNQL